MTLASLPDLLADAESRGVAVGAFNVVTIEHAEGFVAGAESVGTPICLQISQNCVTYHGALAPIAAATLAIARASDNPIAVHLDHAEDAALVRQAVAVGIGSVMFDASTLDYADNVAATAAVVRECHASGVAVEAELGEIGGKDGAHAPGVRTDPGQASRFVAETGVDALAVAVGTSHAMLSRDAVVDHDLIGRLRDTVPVPLVLHGSSGVPDDELARAVSSGIAKVNISTRMNAVFTHRIRAELADWPEVVDPRRYIAPARDAVADETARLLGVLAPPGVARR